MKQFSFKDHKGYTNYVPDGRWVAEGGTRWLSVTEEDDESGSPSRSHHESTTTTVVGTEEPDTIILKLERGRSGDFSTGWGSSRTLYVATEPFGLISGQREDDHSVGGLYFTAARQVHYGELGRLPEIRRPQFARESREYGEGFHEWREGRGFNPMPKRDRRRGKKGWARLADVADIIRMTSEELVRRYFLFTHAEEPALQVLFRERREDIHCMVVPWGDLECFDERRLDELFSRPDIRHAWIRQGFAKTVLYLHTLGHVPEPVVVRESQAIAV